MHLLREGEVKKGTSKVSTARTVVLRLGSMVLVQSLTGYVILGK